MTLTSALGLPDDRRRQLEFLVAAHRLTEITRVNRLLDGTRSETSAEHSWHLALCAVVLAEGTAPGVDLARVLEMLVIHDIVEIDAGDVPIYDAAARIEIEALEHAAAQRLFGLLPEPEGARLLALWQEFEEATSEAARFARAVDRLQPLLLHWAGDGAAWHERGITVEKEREIMALIHEMWPPLWETASALIDDAHGRGMLG
jgi:putative hydrolase of HD superfamily